jgi:hypothetical protein
MGCFTIVFSAVWRVIKFGLRILRKLLRLLLKALMFILIKTRLILPAVYIAGLEITNRWFYPDLQLHGSGLWWYIAGGVVVSIPALLKAWHWFGKKFLKKAAGGL